MEKHKNLHEQGTRASAFSHCLYMNYIHTKRGLTRYDAEILVIFDIREARYFDQVQEKSTAKYKVEIDKLKFNKNVSCTRQRA
jgi:hypothetical protein